MWSDGIHCEEVEPSKKKYRYALAFGGVEFGTLSGNVRSACSFGYTKNGMNTYLLAGTLHSCRYAYENDCEQRRFSILDNKACIRN
jgi:hypothetical protein